MRAVLYTLISISAATMHTVHGGVISLTQASPGYTQNFNTLASTNPITPPFNTVVPDNWFFSEAGTNANSTYLAGTGSGATGDTYSFGATGSSDRAFGELTTGTLNSTFGARFSNGGTTAIESVAIGYDGEQWRLGSTGRTDRLDFQYSLNANSLNTGSWFDFNGLDFLSPETSGTVGLRNGNLSPNSTNLNGTLTDLSIGNNQTLWIRWLGFNATGPDDGLAIDNFTLAANFAPLPVTVPEPSSFVLLLTGLSTTLLCRVRLRKCSQNE